MSKVRQKKHNKKLELETLEYFLNVSQCLAMLYFSMTVSLSNSHKAFELSDR